MSTKRILITGSAGFIGHHLMQAFRQSNHQLMGLDAINSYYEPELKYSRLAQQGFSKQSITYGSVTTSTAYQNLQFVQLDLTDDQGLESLFRKYKFDVVVQLAAQAGVRYSIDNPQVYVASNLVGFANLLEACRKYKPKHLLFASSSSVYGAGQEVPFHVDDPTDEPVSFYAATKKANEVMAYSYAHLYQIPTTGLRFFTVYGPWGRPDMATFSFTKAILEGSPIRVFNNGDMHRDFTFVDDVVAAIVKLVDTAPRKVSRKGTTKPPYKLYNIGNHKPVHLLELLAILERLLGKKALIELHPMQPGDVKTTYADVEDLIKATGFRPDTSLEEGLRQFVNWYYQYYQQQYAVAV
ncbi:NAD-dependent epimerase/dehydratase family protein [Pontibacter ruber]|uniref:NAD-dependent epimerase/dehydratase family protein n=1 Tax=Pontibacter ruber TaxID=1343895 RepID=A0ABW5CWW0_9BACT|nr:NAD-dependent epimerase/dehydratase family protein [Pontibacter ruber]